MRVVYSKWFVLLIVVLVVTMVMLSVSNGENAGLGIQVVMAGSPEPPFVMTFPFPSYNAEIVFSSDALSFSSSNTSTNCRYGTFAYGSLVPKVSDFGMGWYLDFAAHNLVAPNSVEFVQTIRLKQDKDGCHYLPGYSTDPALTNGLEDLILNHPGSLWVIGNEPDRGPNPGLCTGGQDDIHPEVYARAYHDVYHFIKQHDPTALVAIAGLVQVTPGRLQYLDKVWQTYLQEYNTVMPVDVWNMHIYILPEATPDGQPSGVANVALGTDLALAIRESGGDPSKCADPDVYCWAEHDDLSVFAEQVVAMRTWMKQHGEQNKPLILSEYSILYPFRDYDDPINPTTCWLQDENGKCFTAARVSKFMTRTFNYLETAADPTLGYPADNNHLVQQWLWFSMYYNQQDIGYVSNLLEDDYTTLTPVGQIFSSTVNTLATHVNLVATEAAHPAVFTSVPGGTVTAPLSVSIYNNGNTQTTSPFTVTFYSDAARTQIIDTVTITNSLRGCARKIVAQGSWANLTVGVHRYWAWVEGDAPNTQDNVAEGFVLVNPARIFLPVIFR